MKHYLATILLVFSCSVSEIHAATTPEQKLVSTVGRVNFRSGVTFAQANTIAEFYYQHHINGCGAADLAVDKGSRWEVTPRIGIAGAPSKDPIVIEKHTGRFFRKGGPTFNISSITKSQETSLPRLIQKSAVIWPKDLPRKAHKITIQVEFAVLPSGATSFISFSHSSGRTECDIAVRDAIRRWQYEPRKTSITLVESVETCTY